MSKTEARKIYEAIAGAISDRQWRRIRRELGICMTVEEWNLDPLLARDIQAYASLRKLYPRSKVEPIALQRYRHFIDSFPLDGCEGSDLLKAIQRVLTPIPDDRTIRGWGYAIGCPLYCRRWYAKEEINKWVSKILTQRYFSIDFDSRKHKRMQMSA